MPIPQRLDRPARLPYGPGPSDVEPSVPPAIRRPMRRAGLDRARLEQRRLADARRQRLIAVWLRELANRQSS